MKTPPSNVSKECFVMHKRRQRWHFHLCRIRRGASKAMASPEGMSSASSSGASGSEIGPAKLRARPSAFFTAPAGSLRTESRRDTMSFHWNAFAGSCGSGIASLRCRPADTQSGHWRGASLRHQIGIAVAGFSIRPQPALLLVPWRSPPATTRLRLRCGRNTVTSAKLPCSQPSNLS